MSIAFVLYSRHVARCNSYSHGHHNQHHGHYSEYWLLEIRGRIPQTTSTGTQNKTLRLQCRECWNFLHFQLGSRWHQCGNRCVQVSRKLSVQCPGLIFPADDDIVLDLHILFADCLHIFAQHRRTDLENNLRKLQANA